MDERTRLQKDAVRRTHARRAVSPPIERATTLLNASAATLRSSALGPTYAISGGAVHGVLVEALRELEHARHVALAPTGLSAVTTGMLACLKAGDEALVTDAVYWPTRRFCERALGRFGVSTRFYAPRAAPEEVLALVGPQTRLLVLEAPGSLTFETPDFAEMTALARAKGVLTLIDNTWSGGVFCKPLDHGVDLSVQALSKYPGGHSDVFGGSIATNDDALNRRLIEVIDDYGLFVSPDDAWLVLRGLRTLPLRMKAHEVNALEVARWLQAQPEVAEVLYPALPTSPDHGMWRRYFSGASGLMAIELTPGSRAAAEAFLDSLQLFGVGFSWGGFESLATWEDPQLARRAFAEKRAGPLVRLHIGLEAVDDLITDLRLGLDAYRAATPAG